MSLLTAVEYFYSQTLDHALQDFDPDSRAMKDLERFRFFSDDFLYLLNQEDGILTIGDLRFSLLPNSIEPLWVIKLDLNNQEASTPYITVRDVTPEKRQTLWRLLKGEQLRTE
jgi:inner membrane protein